MISSSWPDPVLNSKLFGCAVSEVDDDPVEENGIAAYSQLNSVEDTITPGDLNPLMIPTAVNLSIGQEIPNLSSRMQRNGADKTQKKYHGAHNTLF